MKRDVWLSQMREKVESLYDHLAPGYWVKFGLYPNQTHLSFLRKFLGLVPPGSTLLSAACGAGRYDGLLLEAGHRVVGIDQSVGMLARARERFPAIRYEKMRLQDMDFQGVFEGAICMDAMEHIPPEDWPGILRGFWEALKPGGVFYVTVVLAEGEGLEGAYERAREQGLPVVRGEIADRVEEAYQETLAQLPDVAAEADEAAYHFCPPLDQTRAWIEAAGFVIEAQGEGDWYAHFLVRRG